MVIKFDNLLQYTILYISSFLKNQLIHKKICLYVLDILDIYALNLNQKVLFFDLQLALCYILILFYKSCNYHRRIYQH